jgi:hypothetical protein
MDTVISMVYVENIAFGFHLCRGASEEYICQTAGDAYNCLARQSRINDKTKMIIVTMNDYTYKVIMINGDDIPLSSNCDLIRKKIEEDPPKKMDVVKVLHSNYKIEHYSPYIDVALDPQISIYFKMICDNLIDSNKQPLYQLKSLIWKKIDNEN